MFINMRILTETLTFGLSLFINVSTFGQMPLDGVYQRSDTLIPSNGVIEKMTVTINGDSIWYSKNRSLKTGLALNSRFFFYKGTIRKFRDSYHASLILMECETCPTFWKYTTKPADSIGIKVLYSEDQIDTVVLNGDTAYQRIEVLSDKADDVEVRRLAEMFLTATNNYDLIIDDKLYRRVKSK